METVSSAAAKTAAVGRIKSLDTQLAKNNWNTGSYSDLNKLAQSVLYGDGSQPDAYYEKND